MDPSGESNTERGITAYLDGLVDSREGDHNDARRRLLETVRRELDEVEKQAMSASNLEGQGQLVPGPSSTAISAQLILVEHEREKKQPSEWTVDEVVEWLKGKGFDQDVQHKFIGPFPFSPVITNADPVCMICRAGHHGRCPPRTQHQPSQD